MTLENFSTVTEMKDGLMGGPVSVEELVSMMKKNNLMLKNIGESAKQWSSVASTLAATDNKDSFDQFLRLDGLFLLDQWLREAQNYSALTSDSTVEESISAMLGALMQLPIGKEKSDTSGIRATINNLLQHKSSMIQKRARILFTRWNVGRDNDADQQDLGKEKCDDVAVKTTDATSAGDSGSQGHCSVKGSTDEDNHVAKPVGVVLQHSGSLEGSLSESLEGVHIPASSNLDASQTSLTLKDEDGDQGDPQSSSVMSTSCQKSVSTNKESFIDPGESVATSCSLNPTASNIENMSLDVPESKDSAQDVKETDLIRGPENISEKKVVSVSLTSTPEPHSSSSDPASALQSVTDLGVLSRGDAKMSGFSERETIQTGVDEDSTSPCNPKNEVVDCGVQKHSSEVETKTSAQVDGCYSNASQDLSINCCISKKPEALETTFSRKEGTGAVHHGKEFAGQSIMKRRGQGDYATTNDVSNSIVNTKLSGMVDKSRLDMELEFMVDDALEVATQVAKEVEREVVDYREPFCSSSSGKISEGGILQPSSPDSINGEQIESVMGRLNEAPTAENPDTKGEYRTTSSESMDEPRNSLHNQDLSQVTAVAQEPEGNTEKSMCDFDLNEEVSSDEIDQQQKTPNSLLDKFVPVSKASSSVLAAEPPLHIEEEQGSQRSAATSALCPASLSRTLDGEEALLVEERSDNLKKRQDFQDIDLNVTEGDDNGAIDLVMEKQIPLSSGLPSGESSIEVSSRTADRIKFDLNSIDDNENVPSSDWRTEGRFPYNHLDGLRIPSPASSSSSRQPSMRNIDLNDKNYLCDSYDQRIDLGKSSSQEINAPGGLEIENPVISIMGARVVVNRKELVPQSWSFLPNGEVAGSAIDVNFARSGNAVGRQPAMAYAPSSLSLFGNSSITTGSSVSLSSAMYGPPASAPYVVDSRYPVAQDMMGSMASVPSAYSRPFHMSMISSPSPQNGAGPSRPILDLNSGLAVATEGESSESGALRQLLVLGQGAQGEERTRANMQPLSLELGMKRSEPDSGFDFYPANFKQQQPPWR